MNAKSSLPNLLNTCGQPGVHAPDLSTPYRFDNQTRTMKNVTQTSVPFPHSKIPSLLNHSAIGVITRRSLVVALISLAVVTSTPGARAQNANTAYGTNALRSLTTGSYNSAFGDSALFNNTTGTYNTAVGTSALYRNIAGERNTAVGAGALAYTRAGDNTGIGWQ